MQEPAFAIENLNKVTNIRIMAMLLSKTFRSSKPHSNYCPNLVPISPEAIKSRQSPSKVDLNKPSSSSIKSPISTSSSKNSWTVYLIISSNPPIKTYVGVTNNFSRRLKQHNGELKGGAKASRAGRPWISACVIQGFTNKSKAYEFESQWKIISRKLPRKRNKDNEVQEDNSHQQQQQQQQLLLLQHRCAALNKVQESIDCCHLKIDWHLYPN